jgi:hypothetical protein
MLTEALAVVKSDDLYHDAMVRALMAVYHETWETRYKEYEILSVEKEFRFPLMNPETGANSKTFEEAGMMDVLMRHRPTGRIVVNEHKTTQDSVAPDSDYWDRLRMDTQCSKYFLAAHYEKLGGDVNGILYDVIRKPGNRPLAIPLLDPDGVKIVLDATNQRVRTKDGKKWRESGDTEKGYVLQTRPETPAEFETRLLEVIRADQWNYFAQREVPRLDQDILEYMSDAWALSQQILYFRNRNIWPRNPDACNQFGVCPMFDLCTNRASIDGVRFRTRDKVHPELTIESPAGGLELLTKSRSWALKKCLRYHKLTYEDRVERVDETAEALKVGTLMHKALEAYFIAMKNEQGS